jgi:hypothetical protein
VIDMTALPELPSIFEEDVAQRYDTTADARPTTATSTESSSSPMTATCPARQPQTERKSALTRQPHRNR